MISDPSIFNSLNPRYLLWENKPNNRIKFFLIKRLFPKTSFLNKAILNYLRNKLNVTLLIVVNQFTISRGVNGATVINLVTTVSGKYKTLNRNSGKHKGKFNKDVP